MKDFPRKGQRDMKQPSKQKKSYRVALQAAVSFLALLPFLCRLFMTSISIDTEQMINTPERILTSWLYHERPGLVVTKYLFGQTTFHYGVAVIGAVVFLVAACLLWGWFMEHPTGQKGERSGCWTMVAALFPLLFLTHPVMTEQLHFLLQSMEVAWAILLCLTAAGMSATALWQILVMGGERDKANKKKSDRSHVVL